MGKKYSNLYLKFSAQWLEDEKKADVKAKRDSPQKRKVPEPSAKNAPPAKKPLTKPKLNDVPTLEEVTRDLAKISDARKKASRSTTHFKKPSAPASRPTSKPKKPTSPKTIGTVSSTASGTFSPTPGILTVSINPVKASVKDDLFGDVFSAPPADDDVGVMSDSDGSDECDAEDTLKSTPVESTKAMVGLPAAGEGRAEEGKTADGTAKVRSEGQLPVDGGGAAAVEVTEKVKTAADTRQSRLKKATGTSDSRDFVTEMIKPSVKLESSCDELATVQSTNSSQGKPDNTSDDTGSRLPLNASSANIQPRHSPPAATSAISDDEDPDDPGAPSGSSADGRGSPLVMPLSPRRVGLAASENVSTQATTTAAVASSASSSASTPAASAAAAEPGPSEPPSSVWDGLEDAELGDVTEPPASVWDGMDDSELRDLAEELASEQMALLEERGRQQRDAAGVSDDMYRDVQVREENICTVSSVRKVARFQSF